MNRMSTCVYALNCTLKASPEPSNTQGLIDKVCRLYRDKNIGFVSQRAADFNLLPGITDDAGGGDEWPAVLDNILACDIFLLATPIWMGVRGSIAQRVIERLSGSSSQTNDLGHTPFMNKVGVCVVTGNEDGAHNASAWTLFNLTHLGFAVPPYGDCYWVGEAGPGPSYLEADGDQHLYTNRTARYMVHSSLHMVEVLKRSPFEFDLNQLDQRAEIASSKSGS